MVRRQQSSSIASVPSSTKALSYCECHENYLSHVPRILNRYASEEESSTMNLLLPGAAARSIEEIRMGLRLDA